MYFIANMLSHANIAAGSDPVWRVFVCHGDLQLQHHAGADRARALLRCNPRSSSVRLFYFCLFVYYLFLFFNFNIFQKKPVRNSSIVFVYKTGPTAP